MAEYKDFKEPEGLPEGWKWVRLGEVIEEVKEKVGNKYLEPVAIGIKGVKKRSEIYYKDLAEDYSKNKVFKSGNVAFGLGSNEMAIGVNICNQDYCISPAYRVFELKEQDALYFHYFLSFFKKVVGDKFLILSARQGKAVDFERLFNEYIPLPPFPEQRKIAEILETVDNAIEKTEKIIEKYKRIKLGLMQDLLTKGIDENGNIRSEKTHKFKDSPLGRIPEEWEVVRLGEVVDIKGGKRLPKGEELVDEGYPYIRLSDIKDMKIQIDKVKFITENVRKKISKYTVSKNDVIISIAGTIGLVALIPDDLDNANLTENAVKLTSLLKINRLYLAYSLLSFSLQKQINEMVGIVAQPKLAIFRLATLFLPLPPLPEQQKIAEILSQIDQAIEKEEQYKEKLERLKQGLMQDLLTGKVRVNHLIEEGAENVST
jgi:type I restriction enzyme, S subunit